MEKEMFSPMAIDALGEMMNISLGSSATAVSNMLDHRVDITTPTVSVVDVKDFSLGNLEPAIGVEIKYVEGLEGSNIMLLKRSDIKIIVDILMGMETAEEEFELNELTISCVCEVMNQMMGSAATAMSDFLGFRVDISTPQSFELDSLEHFKQDHMPKGAEQVVVVRFFLKIENALESEFMNVMSVSLAKELLKSLGLESEVSSGVPDGTPLPEAAPEPEVSNRVMSQAEIEALLHGGDSAPAPEPEPSNRVMSQEEIEKLLAGGIPPAEPEPAPAPAGGDKKMSQEDIEKMLAGMNSEPAPAAQAAPSQAPAAQAAPAQTPAPAAPAAQMGQPGQMPPYPYPPVPGPDGQMQGGYMGYPPMYYPPYPYPYPPQAEPQKAAPEPKVIATKPVRMEQMDPVAQLGKEQAQNLDLIMEVPLQVTVEIGRARRKVQDILEFAKGSLVVLDKLAGDQVDLFVNGKCIARGEVVVIEDNFGVRITEIVQTPGIEMLATGR
ncbi:MAG: flagellar motor switch protein FliN [Clostridiales bacterium]|nr:flagellar motor switch protein FliN [Clostridiales bacterium]